MHHTGVLVTALMSWLRVTVFGRHEQALALLQVIALLAEDKVQANSDASHWRLGYSSIQLGIQAACVGLYLVDLLHLRHLRCSPMHIEDPEEFLTACQSE